MRVHPSFVVPVKQVRRDATAGRGRKGAASTERVGQAYVLLIVDYFTKAAEFVYIPDKKAETVARAFHDRWLMRFGVPEWVTSDNGQEFGGAFRHQLERLGIALVHSSPYHPQANGAVERLVRTMKTILAAKAANAVYDWPSLLPQVQSDYMARVHATTQFSLDELVYAKKVKLPPPVGDLHWDASQPAVASLGAYVGERDARFDGFCAAAYDRILRSQRASMDRARVAAARRPGGGGGGGGESRSR